MEQIINIEQVYDIPFGKYDSDKYDGYRITTSTRVIEFLINNYQTCCESWGYIDSADDIKEFIGSNIIDITHVCNDENNGRLKKKILHADHVLDCEFITLHTDNGELTFAVYNSHNGYYGHTVIIKIDDEITKKNL